MPALAPDEARGRFAAARVARLATVARDGSPHIVPITFAVEGDLVYSIVDSIKPKSSQSLARVRNIQASSRVSILVDEYADDWTRLWWVRADGRARVQANGSARDLAIGLLAAKYPQYGLPNVDFGSAVMIDVERWIGWAAGG